MTSYQMDRSTDSAKRAFIHVLKPCIQSSRKSTAICQSNPQHSLFVNTSSKLFKDRLASIPGNTLNCRCFTIQQLQPRPSLRRRSSLSLTSLSISPLSRAMSSMYFSAVARSWFRRPSFSQSASFCCSPSLRPILVKIFSQVRHGFLSQMLSLQSFMPQASPMRYSLLHWALRFPHFQHSQV